MSRKFNGTTSGIHIVSPDIPVSLTSDQLDLLTFVRGIGHHWGTGITTHKVCGNTDDWRGQAELHQACLELERKGLIYRHHETDSVIVWESKPFR